MKTKTVLRNNEVQLLAKLKNEDDFVKLDSWKKKKSSIKWLISIFEIYMSNYEFLSKKQWNQRIKLKCNVLSAPKNTKSTKVHKKRVIKLMQKFIVIFYFFNSHPEKMKH